MKLKFRRVISAAIITAMSISLCACNSDEISKEQANTLSYWVTLEGNAATSVSDYGETPFSKELQKRTGITINYQHPPQGKQAEKFNILVVSDELPDIIEYKWMDYPGGPEKAIEDGIIQELDFEHDAPNLYKYLQENPDVDKLIKTDSGKYFAFPFIRGDKTLQTSAGIMIRKDWLDELNMAVPETMDEWDAMLKAFKEQKGAKYPIIYNTASAGWGAFVGAYNTYDGLYVDGDTVKYGAMEPGFKEYIAKMNEWYKNGYIATDFASMDGKDIDAAIVNGDTGVATGSVGSGMGRWTSAATQEGFSLVAAPYPTLNKGEKAEFGQMQLKTPGTYAAISTSCKNKELACKLLDYGYSEEGEMLYNFGIEGESYEMKDGYPTFTDLITNNPDGLSMSGALARYVQSYDEGPFVQDKRYMEQYASLPQQKEAIEVWSNTNMEAHMLPTISLTAEQSAEISKKVSSITTYKDEMLLKFIMGIEPMENWETFTKELENRGVNDYIQLMQEAYERYQDR